MSIDLNWDRLTTGPDGQELAERIRDFIHSKFQTVPLPRFIKSVTVHDFEFGSIAPELELKDITDPLPDFYEDDEEADSDTESGTGSGQSSEIYTASGGAGADADHRRHGHRHDLSSSSLLSHATIRPGTARPTTAVPINSGGNGPGVPGVPGGTSNLLHHFHSHLAPGWSGAQTPLAAMAAHNGYYTLDPPDHSRQPSQPSRSSSISMGGGGGPDGSGPASTSAPLATAPNPALLRPLLREKHSVSTLAPTSAGGTPSRPPTRGGGALPSESAIEEDEDDGGRPGTAAGAAAATAAAAAAAAAAEGVHPIPPPHRPHEPRAEDLQAVFRIRYAGDIKLLLTADILLDYPMPSFVGIPVRLSITGLTFDGVGVLAYIRRRIHFCFLGPDDALAAVGADEEEEEEEKEETNTHGGNGHNEHNEPPMMAIRLQGGSAMLLTGTPAPPPTPPKPRTRVGGLLQEVRVESEIGQRQSGKQSLKNVGKVERFVLEQVRRIFEEEFVYPSFWTFLV